MNYMMDKINLLENKGAIIEGAEEIVKLLLSNKKLDDSEKLMTIESVSYTHLTLPTNSRV